MFYKSEVFFSDTTVEKNVHNNSFTNIIYSNNFLLEYCLVSQV